MKIQDNLRKAAELGVGLTFIATLILAGCGGGGGSSSSSGGGVATTLLDISPSLGKFMEGATVRIKDKNGVLVGEGRINASGVASVPVPTTAPAPLVVEAGLVGDKYFDEKAQGFVTVSGVSGVAVRALVPDHTAVSQVAVTPLTEFAVGALANASGTLPAGITTASAVGANATVAQTFGVSDVLAAPTLVASASAVGNLGATPADIYAIKLAALAHMATAGETAMDVAHRLRNDLNSAAPASGVRAVVQDMNNKISTMPALPPGANLAQVPTLPPAALRMIDLAKANMEAAQNQLANLNTQLTKAQQLNAMLTASLNNASAVMAAMNANATLSIQSAVAAAVAQVQLNATAAMPTITSFSPASGVVGTTVTITGINFNASAAQNEVRFGGAKATVSAASTTSLTVTVPSGALSGPIVVIDMASLYKGAMSASNFTVNAPAVTTPTTPVTPTGGVAGNAAMLASWANAGGYSAAGGNSQYNTPIISKQFATGTGLTLTMTFSALAYNPTTASWVSVTPSGAATTGWSMVSGGTTGWTTNNFGNRSFTVTLSDNADGSVGFSTSLGEVGKFNIAEVTLDGTSLQACQPNCGGTVYPTGSKRLQFTNQVNQNDQYSLWWQGGTDSKGTLLTALPAIGSSFCVNNQLFRAIPNAAAGADNYDVIYSLSCTAANLATAMASTWKSGSARVVSRQTGNTGAPTVLWIDRVTAAAGTTAGSMDWMLNFVVAAVSNSVWNGSVMLAGVQPAGQGMSDWLNKTALNAEAAKQGATVSVP